MVLFLSIWDMWNIFLFNPWVNHQTNLSLAFLKIWPFFIPMFCFLLTLRFFLFCFLCLTCWTSLLHLCMYPGFSIAVHGVFVCCMQYLLIYSFSLPHHLELIAAFTIIVSSPNLSSDRDGVTVLFLKSSLILSPIWNYQREFDILLIPTCMLFPVTGEEAPFKCNPGFKISKKKFRILWK